MNYRWIVSVAILLLSSCSSVEDLTGNNPIVDTKGVNMANYETDLAQCQEYASQVEIAQKATTGAVTGAIVGGVIGAIWGNSSTAERSAGVGAVGGGVSGVTQGVRDRERVIKRCLSGRGYRVLN